MQNPQGSWLDMKLPPGHPFSLDLPLSLCHLPSPLLRSTQLPPGSKRCQPSPTGRQPPPRIKLRTRHGPGTDRRRGGGLGATSSGKEKEMFQLGSHNKGGCRPQVREDRRETGSRASRAGRTCPAPGVHTEPPVCRQTGGMRPEQQWPKLITSAPRRAPGNVTSMPEHLSMRGEKGHNSHKN